MRAMIYVLTDGTEVKSFDVAKASGQDYTIKMVEVAQEKTPLSPIRQAMLDQFGYVHPSLKDKVVLP